MASGVKLTIDGSAISGNTQAGILVGAGAEANVDNSVLYRHHAVRNGLRLVFTAGAQSQAGWFSLSRTGRT